MFQTYVTNMTQYIYKSRVLSTVDQSNDIADIMGEGKGEDEKRKHSDASRNFCHAASNFTNTPPLGLEEKIKWTFGVKFYLEHIL